MHSLRGKKNHDHESQLGYDKKKQIIMSKIKKQKTNHNSSKTLGDS
jgi:hypothetical protein